MCMGNLKIALRFQDQKPKFALRNDENKNIDLLETKKIDADIQQFCLCATFFLCVKFNIERRSKEVNNYDL